MVQRTECFRLRKVGCGISETTDDVRKTVGERVALGASSPADVRRQYVAYDSARIVAEQIAQYGR